MSRKRARTIACLFPVIAAGLIAGCRAPAARLRAADEAAYAAIARARRSALGRAEPLTVEPPAESFRRRLIETQALPVAAALTADTAQLPDVPGWNPLWRNFSGAPAPEIAREDGDGLPIMGMREALRIAAHGNRDYQARKEALFLGALDLDLEEENFRNSLAGMLGGRTESAGGDETVTSAGAESSISAGRLLQTGAKIAAALTFDLVKLLTQTRASAFGVRLDSSITVPLGRGAGRHVVMESLTQAQRDLLVAVWEFEHYKADFAVEVAQRYFNVLAAGDQERNADDNLRRLQLNARRARRMADAGRLPEIQVDQAVQEELRAFSRSLAAARRHADVLDQFKIFLGLPPDADLRLDRAELENLAGSLERFSGGTDAIEPEPAALAGAAPAALPPENDAIVMALENRLDLRAVMARVEDAQRKLVVAARALGPDAALSGEAAFGERRSLGATDQGNARLDFGAGRYGAALRLEAPWRRTAARNAMRRGLVQLEQAVRRMQEMEDRVKLQVRGDLRGLALARRNLNIQAEAVRLAERRVQGSDLFLESGRAAVRDVLEAQDALLAARNGLIDALVEQHLGELGFQRNLGMLSIDERGLRTEWNHASERQP